MSLHWNPGTFLQGLEALDPISRTKPLHLATDLDGTWILEIGTEGSLGRLETYLAGWPDLVLTFATGRGLDSAVGLLIRHAHRMPDHLVTDVGTALYHPGTTEGWIEDQAYARWLDARWEPDLKERLLREGLPEGVTFQEGVEPRRRLALSVLDPRDLPRASAEIQVILDLLGVQAEVLASGNRCIDVLPQGVDKGSAIEFLECHWGTPRPLISCGDTENDLGLFRIADLAVLMPDSSVDPAFLPKGRTLCATKAGPEGILEVLQSMEGALLEKVP